jgi:hypothetical protein
MKRFFFTLLLILGLGFMTQPSWAQATRTLVAYVGAWSGLTSYNVNDMVTYSGVTYISKSPTNLGHTPTLLS